MPITRIGDLIAVNGVLYTYLGRDEGIHKVSVVDIDAEGILTDTHNTWYLTDSELSHRGIDLTETQWIGVVSHLLREKYNLTEEKIAEASTDIVCRCFALARRPMIEELPRYLNIYLNR